MNLNDVLRLLRIAHDYTICDLAAKLDVSRSHLSRVERGEKNPSKELIRKYSDFFKISMETIEFFDTQKNKENMEYQKLLLLVLNKICK